MDYHNILKINVQNKIIKVKQFSKWNFVNIILSIIEYNLNFIDPNVADRFLIGKNMT